MTDDAKHEDSLIDDQLAALFATAGAAPDESFVGRVERAVLAEQRMTAARKALWRRFGIEAAGSIAVVTAFVLLGRLGPFAVELGQGPFSPAVAAGLALILWLAVEMRPVPRRAL